MTRQPTTSVSINGRPMTPFGEWLFGELVARGWTQLELARRMDRSSGMVSNMLYRHIPTDETCDLLAEVLDVPVDTVLAQTDERRLSRSRIYRKIETMTTEQLRELADWLRR